MGLDCDSCKHCGLDYKTKEPCTSCNMDQNGDYSEWEEQDCEEQDCDSCKHGDAVCRPDTVGVCTKYSRWEPKETNANLEGNSNMRTQEIYTGIVTENEKIKDDNGQIESIKKRVIYSTFDTPAFDEANAKVKILAAASKVQGKNAIKDLDEVEVKVRPF